jgi:hypothetical protein
MQTNYPRWINFDMVGAHSHLQESTAWRPAFFATWNVGSHDFQAVTVRYESAGAQEGTHIQAQLAPGKAEAPHEKQSKQLTEREQ